MGNRIHTGRLLLRLIGMSLRLDFATLGIRGLTRSQRLRFLSDKYRAITRVTRGDQGALSVGQATIRVASLSDIGTTQSSLVDVWRELGDREPGQTVVDVGANIGQFALAVVAFFPDTHVLAFEPDPDTFAHLRQNVADLGAVECRNIGIGRRAGRLPLYRGDISVTSSFLQPTDDGNGVEVEVEVDTLDHATNDIPRIDLLKVDVEGFEREVVGGATKTLGRTNALFLELSFDRRGGEDNLALLGEIDRAMGGAAIKSVGRPYRDDHGRVVARDILICATR